MTRDLWLTITIRWYRAQTSYYRWKLARHRAKETTP